MAVTQGVVKLVRRRLEDRLTRLATAAVADAEREVIRAAKEWGNAAEKDADTATELVYALDRLREAEDKLAALKGGK